MFLTKFYLEKDMLTELIVVYLEKINKKLEEI